MKLGVIITMYDEIDITLQTINNIKINFNDAVIVVVHSDDGSRSQNLEKIKTLSNKYILLEDLGKVVEHKWLIPARSITRNISTGFRALYEMLLDLDCIVVMTGDTLVTDSINLYRRYNDMIDNNWIAMVSQAIGQNFHSASDNPINGVHSSRHQHNDITDFMPQLIFIDGKIANETKVFSDIKITNKWTTEQCLGDELMIILDNRQDLFKQKVGILNEYNRTYAYAYNDGIVYQAKTGSPSR